MIWPFAKQRQDAPPQKTRVFNFPLRKRGYAAATQDRLTADFLGTTLSADRELISGLVRMRARARQLAMDNDYARKFLAMVKNNVVGPTGIRLQARTRRDDGSLDQSDNELLEMAWREWGRPENCTVTRRVSWSALQRQAVETVGRDGECLVLMLPGHGPGGFALQILEADYLDVNHNAVLGNGRRIVMGVEIDQYGAPVAYHLRKSHPGDVPQISTSEYNRVPASQVIHLFLPDRPGQTRGVPWMHTAIQRLNMLGKYEQAELVAAREAAAKMGFFYSEDGQSYTADGTDDQGNLIEESEPGQFRQLPVGVRFESYNPTHPTDAFGVFCKEVKRGFSSGLLVAYNSLANDLEGVNFSSIRSGVLEERDQWRVLQQWLIEQLCDPVYRAWLRTVIGTEKLQVPERRIPKFQNVTWQPRGWQWVDPNKDIEALSKAYRLSVISPSEICSMQGRDYEEVLAQIAADKKLAEQYGVDIDAELTTNDAKDDQDGQPVPLV